MKRYTYNPETAHGWKSYPIRVVGPGKSPCCEQPKILVESSEGGFVPSNCSKCGEKDNLSIEEFKSLGIWVVCPECRRKMEPVQNSEKNYVFECRQCEIYIWLADLLPKWKDLETQRERNI